MYKEDLALNTLQGLICHKNQPNNLKYIHREIYTGTTSFYLSLSLYIYIYTHIYIGNSVDSRITL